MTEDFATLGCDATSLDEHHVKSVYVANPGQKFNISIVSLLGAKTIDYVTHVTATIDLMSTNLWWLRGYADICTINLKQIIDTITSSISDRVNTNTAVVKTLSDLWEKDLHDLMFTAWTGLHLIQGQPSNPCIHF